MRLAIIVGLALTASMATDRASAQTWESSSGNMKSSPGAFGAAAKPQRSGVAPIAPIAPIGRAGTTTEPQVFKPYKPKSVYSDRGGVNAYPEPAKPKGYVDIYGNKKMGPFAF
jgi:hypothetical protein